MSSTSIAAKIALPYAEALLESIQAVNLREVAKKDLCMILDILESSNELSTFLENPLVTASAKKNIIRELLSNQINEIILTFLLVLIDRKRISLLKAIIGKYFELAYELESTTVVDVITSVSLTEDQHNTLIEKLQKITGTQHIKLMVAIDPDLIGGFIIQIGSKVIDTSLRGQLQQMAYYLNIA